MIKNISKIILAAVLTLLIAIPAFAQSIPTVSPWMYFGGGTRNIRTVASTTKVLIGATATTTGSYLETPSAAITGLSGEDCIGTDGSGNLISGTCGSGSGGLATSTPWTALNLVQVVDNGTVTSIATSSLGLPTFTTLEDYVPYTGAASTVNLGLQELRFSDGIDFSSIRDTGSAFEIVTRSNNALVSFLNQISNFAAVFDFSAIDTSDKTFSFPNETGTLALGTGSTGNCAEWDTTNTLTDSGEPCGSGSGSSEWTDDGGFLYPNEGDYIEVPFLNATGTLGVATSTFSHAVVTPMVSGTTTGSLLLRSNASSTGYFCFETGLSDGTGTCLDHVNSSGTGSLTIFSGQGGNVGNLRLGQLHAGDSANTRHLIDSASQRTNMVSGWHLGWVNDANNAVDNSRDIGFNRAGAGVVKVNDGSTGFGDVTVLDDAYAAGWDGSQEVPTKNALYDKIETVSAGGGTWTDGGTFQYPTNNEDTYIGTSTAVTGTPLFFAGTTTANFLAVSGTTGRVGVNITNPTAGLQIVNANGAADDSATIFQDYYVSDANGANHVFRKSRGTPAAPAAVVTNDQMSFVGGRMIESDTLVFPGSSASAWTMNAREVASSTARGSYQTWSVTPINSTTRGTRMLLDNTGWLSVGANSFPGAVINPNGAQTSTAWGTNGLMFRVSTATLTDSSSSGTVAGVSGSSFLTPTIAASNSTTYTDSATLYVSAQPTAGTNVTLTNRYAAWIDAGDVRFDGDMIAPSAASGYYAGALPSAGTAPFQALGNGNLTAQGSVTLSSGSTGNGRTVIGDTITNNSLAKLTVVSHPSQTFSDNVFTAASSTATTTGFYVTKNNLVGAGTTSPVARLESWGASGGTIFNLFSDVGSNIMNVLNTGVATLLGEWDFGGATRLEIPNGTGPTANDPGEIAHDTTDNQLILDDFVVAKATQKIWSTTIASTSPAFIASGLVPIPVELDGYTMTAIRCKVDSGTSKVIAVEDASANSTEDITCATSVTSDDGSITNAAATAAEEMYIDFGATSGAVDYVTITVFGQWTRE